MAFSAQTLDFLMENRLNDNKEWFKAHNEEYKKYITEPFKEFTEKVMPAVQTIDTQASYIRISRIYRDARFAKGSIFRENMWCIFGRQRDLYLAGPVFYFDISPKGFEYGAGFYMTSTETMNALRGMVINDSPIYIAAEEALGSQQIFTIYGDMYKKNHFPNESDKKIKWLNRKNIGISTQSQDWELLFSDSLSEKIISDFKMIASVYNLMLTAYEMTADKD